MCQLRLLEGRPGLDPRVGGDFNPAVFFLQTRVSAKFQSTSPTNSLFKSRPQLTSTGILRFFTNTFTERFICVSMDVCKPQPGVYWGKICAPDKAEADVGAETVVAIEVSRLCGIACVAHGRTSDARRMRAY